MDSVPRIHRSLLPAPTAITGIALVLLWQARQSDGPGLTPLVIALGVLFGLSAVVVYFARNRERTATDAVPPVEDEAPGAGRVRAGEGGPDRPSEPSRRDPSDRPRDPYVDALDRLPALIWRTSPSGRCDFHNLAWLEFTGRTFEEEWGVGWTEGVHPDDVGPLMERFGQAFRERQPFEMEYRLLHRSGEYRRISDHAQPIREPGGGFGGYLGIAFDLSALERVDAALRKSEETFRNIFQNASVGMARMDPAGRFILANRAYLEMVGYSMDELANLTVHEITHPEDRARNEELFGQLIRGEIPSFEILKRYARKDGRELWVSKSVSAVFDPSGHALYVQSIIQDVTEQRRDRLELEKRELLLREAQEIARMGGWEWDLRTDRVEWSEAMFDLCGLAPGSPPPSYAEFLTLVHPEDRGAVEEDVRRTIEEGVETETVFRVTRPDGSIRWLQGRRRLVRPREGKRPHRMTGTTQDITELKEAEEAVRRLHGGLREREAELSEAQEIAHVGNWVWDIEANRVAWSDELYRIYGHAPQSFEVDYEKFLALVPPEDRQRVDEMIKRAYESGEPFEFYHGVTRPDGEVRTVHARGRVVRDDDGRPLRMMGTGQDVTEIALAQRALRRSEENFRQLAENVGEMIVRFTRTGRVTYASPATRPILGYDPQDVLGREGAEFLHPEDRERVAEAHRGLLAGEEPAPVLCRLLRKDGRPVWVETTTRAIQDGDEVAAIVAVARDVTESVKAARAARLLQEVAMAANESGSEREAFQTALRLVCEHTGWPVGHVYIPSSSVAGQLSPSDIWHLDDPARHAAFREVTRSIRLPPGQGLPGRVLQTGRAEWVRDIQADPTFIRAALAKNLGVRAALAFPVRTGDETIAVIEFFSDQPEDADGGMVDLMDIVGSQLGEVLRRRWAEQALRVSEERFRALAESANDAIVTIDDRGRVVFCNESLERIFGYSCKEMTGEEVTRLMPQRFRETHRAGLERYMATGDEAIVGRTVELIGLRKDGTEFPVELSLAAWETDRGRFVTGILRDITARKRAEKSLEEKVEELARSNAELGLFTYIASHDLREPLRTVGSNLQLLERRLEEHIDGDARKQIDFARGGVRRMQALIDDLLLYSRVGTEGRVLEDVDSRTVVEEAVQALSTTIEESGGRVTLGDLPVVQADRSQLAQLFQNLISNAIKFRADAPPRVEVTAEREEDAWIFAVRDNGIGIEARYAEHVFTIFQRLHAPDKYPGTGIGLAVCRKIVERHGGRIWVESAPGGSSVFKFTVPRRRR